MCECLRGIFRVSWTPSSDADSDREDSHGNPEARVSPINNKRRSPPSDKPPFGPHPSTHHSISTDEQDSPERIVQKEKLHAELKQVLSQKRNQLRDTQSTSTDMDEPSRTDSKNEAEKDMQLSELVEVVVETEAEVGASGYSVVGGGERGIFIKDVLKDSPAAKHLSLQKGDQLLSARVYFDNVKYEDALKILQCAEPYKVSFFLKRTVPESEVSIRPGAQTLDLRGPKAKMQRMSVKSVKPFKTKKRRGGRFGLKRLKENKKARERAELDIEGLHGRSDLSPVDVEFVFPKFKLRKGGKSTAGESGHLEGMITGGKKKRKIRFPKLKGTDAAVSEGNVNVDVSTHEKEGSGAKLKGRAKGAKFGMNFPRLKKSKLDVKSSNDNVEVKEQEAKLKPPSVDCDFNITQGKAEANAPNLEVGGKGKGEGPEIKMTKINLDVSDPKMTIPTFKLPKVRLSCHSDEIDGEASKQIGTTESKPKMTNIDIKTPTVDMDVNIPKFKMEDVEGTKINTHKFDPSLPKLNLDAKQIFGDEIDGSMVKKHEISLPKLDIEVPEINTSDVDIVLPRLDVSAKSIDSGGRVSTGASFKMTKLDISLPKVKSPEGEVTLEGPGAKGGKFHKPNISISLPKERTAEANIGHSEKKANVKMPQIDISHPEIYLPQGQIDIEGPKGEAKVDISNEMTERGADIKGHFDKGGKFKMPAIDVSLPNVKLPEHTIAEGPAIKEGKFNMPSYDTEGNVEVGDLSAKGGKFKMPHLDVSLPKMNLSTGEIKIEDSGVKGEKKSLPKGKVEAGVEVQGYSGKAEMPQIDVKVSLPEGKDINVKTSGKREKAEMPKVDISLPAVNSPGVEIFLPKMSPESDISIEVPDSHIKKGGKFQMPKIDLAFPKIKSRPVEVNLEGPEVKGGKVYKPSIDISLPKDKTKTHFETEGNSKSGMKLKMPKMDNSLPRAKAPEGEMKVEAKEETIDIKSGKFHMPSTYITLPEAGTGGHLDVEGHGKKGGKFEIPKNDVSLPKLKPSEAEVIVECPDIQGGKVHMPSIDITLPVGGVGSDLDVKGNKSKGRRFEMPKFDVSLPKLKTLGAEIHVEGPDLKGGKFHMPSVDISPSKGGAGADVDVKGRGGKGGQFEMPKFDVSLPKLKPSEAEVNIEGPDIKSGKFHMPSLDISPQREGAEGDVDVKAHGRKGGKLEMPKLDVSLPKFKAFGAEINTEDPNIKGEKLHMPSLDISLPGGDVDVEEYGGKGGNFEMPKLDVSLPKFKPSGAKINVEGPDIKGGKFNMPSVDISLPGGKAGGNVDVKAHGGQGEKFEMPKLDVSLPKLKTSGGEINIEGPDIKGEKFHMPSVDISLPGGRAEGDVGVKAHGGKGGKFEMPKLDISLPKFKPSGAKVNVEGPDFKGGKFHMPSLDISLPGGGAESDVDVAGHGGKGGKFEIPKLDVSLPKLKPSGGEINIEGPDIKGGKFHMPSVDISLPRGGAEGDVDVEGHGGKFEMPKFDISMPKFKPSGADVNLEGPDIKGGKFHMPSLDISLPGGKAEGGVDVKAHGGKGGKFEMPKLDVSLPKFKPSGAKVNVEGPDIKGGKFHMPSLDISLPRGGAEGDVDVEGHGGKGGKFEMPKFDVSMPKFKPSGADVNVEGPDIKGGKFHMPSVDISLPGGRAEGDVDVKGHGGKGGKFEMPKLDVSLPKLKPSGGEINIEGPDIESGKFNMPSIDISLPRGGAGGDVDVEGHGGKFKMPKFDVSLPKFKRSGADVNVEGPDIEGGKFHMPSVDISLPGGKAEGGVDVKGHKVKGGKFEMPKLDVSLPKLKTSGGEINIEGPDIEGGKFHMPSVDISLPKGGAGGDVGVKARGEKGGKFEMPKFDVSLPKFKRSGADVNVEGPDIEGGKFHMPSVDISQPGGGAKGNVDVKGHGVKGGQFEMPKLDVSLPKLKPSGGEINIEGPDIESGKFNIPSVDISLPKGGAEGDVDVKAHGGKGGKFEMPKLDVSLPKFKPSGAKVNVEGPNIEGGKFHMPSIDISLPGGRAEGGVDVKGLGGKGGKLPKLDVSLPKFKQSRAEVNVEGANIEGGCFQMPLIDISLPREGAEGDVDAKGHPGKGGKFKMPKLDVSLPKFKSPGAEINVESPDIKGENSHMPTIDISLPKIKLECETDVGLEKEDISVPKIIHGARMSDINVPEVTLGGNIKLPTVKLPTVDISAPKVDLDFSLPKAKSTDRENVELLKAEDGRPSSGSSFDVPEVSLKLPKISLPKFGRKLKSGDKLELESPGLSIDLDTQLTSPSIEADGKMKEDKIKMPSSGTAKKDIEIIGPNAEIMIQGSTGEITKPEIKMESPDDKAKYKLKFPKFKTTIPKPKLKDVEMDMPAVDGKGKVKIPAVEISLPTANIPDCEVLLPKTEVDVSEADIRGYEGSLKIPKMPTIDISVPKVDVSLPRIKLHEPMDSSSSDLNIECSKGTSHFPHVTIPKVDLSLPHGKTGDADNHEVEIRKRGKLRMPEVEISLPHGKHNTSNNDMEIKGEKLQISVPTVDPDLDISVKESRLKMPTIDSSLPHGIKRESQVPYSEQEGAKIKMPIVDISLPNVKHKDGIKLPTVEISLPQGQVEDTDIPEPRECGKEGKFKIPNIDKPKVDISLQGQQEATEKTEVRRQSGHIQLPKITMPKVDISLPHHYPKTVDPEASGSVGVDTDKIPKVHIGMSKDAELSDEDKTLTMQTTDIEIPGADLGLDLDLSKKGKRNKKNKKKNEPQDPKGPKVKGSKFNIGMPKVKVSASGTDINKTEKGADANLKADLQAPKIPEIDFDIGTAQVETNFSEGDKKQKIKIPKFGIPLPSLTSPEANITPLQIKGHSIPVDSEVEYEGPRLPKVTKAVFVMVNPQTESSASAAGETSAEIEKEKLKQTKITMKQSFGKSTEKGKAIHYGEEVEFEGKSKTGKLKLPKVTFSSGQKGSFDVTPSGSDDGASPSLNGGDKDERAKFGKLKLPKLEFFSPYSKDTEEELEISMRKETSWELKETKETKTTSSTMSFPGLKKKPGKDEEVQEIGTLVSSKARTEMLAEREGSESPAHIESAGFVSLKKSEEREETTWFKVPKVTLSPHSTGILHITPESSPKASKSSIPGSSEQASGGFYVKMPSVEYLTQEMSSEHTTSKTEGTRTVVTKMTKYTETKTSSSKQ
nr:periaxin isoform X17 [Danio rerio]|eukprot:XP_017207622.1 periaxin isoform X17 [Danio rerio]